MLYCHGRSRAPAADPCTYKARLPRHMCGPALVLSDSHLHSQIMTLNCHGTTVQEKKRKNKAAVEPANGKKAKPAPVPANSAAKPAPKAEPALTANAPAPVATKPGEKKPKKKAKAADTKDAK